MCDLTVAAENAMFPIRSATGLYRRPDRGTGGAHSTQGCVEMLLLCRILDPQRASMSGLVTGVPTGQQVGVALKMAREMTESRHWC